MGKQKVDKTVYTEVLATTEGEVVTSKTVYKTQSEPDFVKLYIDCVFTVKGVRKGINPIFFAFLEHMSYADVNEENGGQIIYVNKAMKMNIAKKLGLGLDSINKGLSELTKHGLFKRINVATYQVNPHIVGRGEWKDIKSIQATFNFSAKGCDVVADIVKEEETQMTTATEALEEQYQQKMKRLASQDQDPVIAEKQIAFADLPTQPATITVTAPDALSATTI